MPTPALRFTRAGVRAVDRAALEELRIPGLQLMEEAARALESTIAPLLGAPGHPLVILCGSGNNGGDGLALARRLFVAGHRPIAVALASPRDALPGAAATSLHMVEALRSLSAAAPLILDLDPENPGRAVRDTCERLVANLPASADAGDGRCVVVDALLGTGLDRPVRPGPIAELVDTIAELRDGFDAVVVAVDTPTGLDCDTGAPLGETVVRADVTVTMCGAKVGFDAPGADAYTGRVEVGSIGVPDALLARFAAAG